MKTVLLSLFICLFFGSFQCFILDRQSYCNSDDDCNGGCCLAAHDFFGLVAHKCGHYTMPGHACDNSTTVCGCMPGYSCEMTQLSGSIALEPHTHLRGACKPKPGTNGTLIAVEGGR